MLCVHVCGVWLLCQALHTTPTLCVAVTKHTRRVPVVQPFFAAVQRLKTLLFSMRAFFGLFQWLGPSAHVALCDIFPFNPSLASYKCLTKSLNVQLSEVYFFSFETFICTV